MEEKRERRREERGNCPEGEKVADFRTGSGRPVKTVYGPEDMEGWDPARDVGQPGCFPYTRGIHPDMYRGKPWTKRFYAGFGRPEETNQRLKYLLDRGQTAIIIVPDCPSQLGIDADHPLARGNVGLIGYPMCSLWELEETFQGIPLERISVSLQWTTIAAIVGFSAYIALAERRGLKPSQLQGSIYNDPLHAHFCTYEISSPLKLGIKLAVDIVEHSVRHMPRWHPLVPGGYEMREWGISAAQELAFTLAIVREYVEAARRRGLSPDAFLPRMVFSMSVEMDLFEEVAKFRAARRIWARFSKERLGAEDPRSHRLKISAKTSGSSLTAQQPINNVVRTTIEALAAALGGVQVIEPCGYDEAYTIPSEQAATVALHLQHILHHEARLANAVDPLGGSYFVERLTNEIEEQAWEILRKIEERGGIASAIEKGWLREEVKREAVRRQREIDEGERVIVGLNGYALSKEEEIPLKVQRDRRLESFSREQEERIRQFKEGRDPERWREALERLGERARRGEGENLVLPVLEALKAGAAMGEILGVIRQAYGLSYDPFNQVEAPF